jgi:hypothetical protein
VLAIIRLFSHQADVEYAKALSRIVAILVPVGAKIASSKIADQKH